MTGCSAPKCTNNSDEGFSFYRIPANPERRKKWLLNSGCHFWNPPKNARLCSAHFENCQFEQNRADGKKQLVPFAVPTIFNVPYPPKLLDVPKKSVYMRFRDESESNDFHSPKRLNLGNTELCSPINTPVQTTNLVAAELPENKVKRRKDQTMTKHCVFGGCKSDSRYGPPVEFVSFQKACLAVRKKLIIADKEHIKQCLLCEKCKRWMYLCKRKHSKFNELFHVTKHTYICKNHFVDQNGPSKLYPDPLTALQVIKLRSEQDMTNSKKMKILGKIAISKPEVPHNQKSAKTTDAPDPVEIAINHAEEIKMEIIDEPLCSISEIKLETFEDIKDCTENKWKSDEYCNPSISNFVQVKIIKPEEDKDNLEEANPVSFEFVEVKMESS